MNPSLTTRSCVRPPAAAARCPHPAARRGPVPRAKDARRAVGVLGALLCFACAGGGAGPAPGSDAGADGGAGNPITPRIGTGPLVAVTGLAQNFGGTGGSMGLAGAIVTVAELPERTAVLDGQGTFRLEVPSGGEYSFALSHPGYHTTQSATLPVGDGGLQQLGFQVLSDELFNFVASVLGLSVDPTRCQLATTVSAFGTDPYGGSGLGVPDVTVTLDPALPPEAGPVYFRYLNRSLITPDRTLTATTIDGGVIFLNVPVGRYRLTAHKTGVAFSSVTLDCRAGQLVNAAPPWGLQELRP